MPMISCQKKDVKACVRPSMSKGTLMPEPIVANDEDTFQSFLDSELPVFVDFWAPWCDPCRPVTAMIDAFAKEYAGKALFAKVNIEENPATPANYNVMGVPTVIGFKNGKEMERMVGVHSMTIFRSMIDSMV